MTADGRLLRTTTASIVDLPAQPDTAGAPVACCWRYDPADPWAVCLQVRSGRVRWVDWYLARDLLAAGLGRRTGVGDVTVEPWPGDGLLVTLDSPTGRALLLADARHAAYFLAGSYRLVPPGAERLDVDIEWELLAVEESW